MAESTSVMFRLSHLSPILLCLFSSTSHFNERLKLMLRPIYLANKLAYSSRENPKRIKSFCSWLWERCSKLSCTLISLVYWQDYSTAGNRPRLRPYVPQDNLADIHLPFARTILKMLPLLRIHSKQAESVGAWLEETNNPIHVEQHAQINFPTPA